MKAVLFAVPLMIIATLLYMHQSEKVNKDIDVKHQEFNVQAEKFDNDFDRRWGDKSAEELAQQKAEIESQKAELQRLKVEQKIINDENSKARENIKNKLNNELDESNSDSVYSQIKG